MRSPIVQSAMLLCLLLSLTGCSVKGMLAREPISEKIYIHPGIKVGDYARYRSPDQDRYRYEYRVVDRQGERFEVVFRWIEGAFATLEKHLFVDADGRVDDAYLLDTESGERTPIAVEGVSTEGFYRQDRFERFAVPQRIEQGGRTYQVEYTRVYRVNASGIGVAGGVEIIVVDLIDPSVPFGVIKSAQDVMVEKSILDYSGFVIKAALPNVFDTYDVLDAFLKAFRSQGHQFKQHFVLDDASSAPPAVSTDGQGGSNGAVKAAAN